jgi:hypothetical protein
MNGVRVMLILGPTGTRKSVHSNMAIAHEQKYGGLFMLALRFGTCSGVCPYFPRKEMAALSTVSPPERK